MFRDPFWKSARILLHYKGAILAATAGALLSAVCFGAGLSMIFPVVKLLLQDQENVADLIRRAAEKDWMPLFARDGSLWLADHVPQQPFHAFLAVMAILLALTIIGNVGRYFHESITITVVQHAALVWRSRMFRRLIRTPMVELLRTGSSDNISKVAFDTRPLASAYKAVLGKSVEQILKGGAALVLALVLDWRLTLTALVVAPVLAVLLRQFGKRIRRAAKNALRMRGRMIAALKEAMGGIRVVKVHSAEGYERRRFSQINRRLFAEEMRIRSVRALASPLIDVLGVVGVVLVTCIAAYNVLGPRRMDPAEFITVLFALAGAAGSLKPLSTLNNDLNEGRAAADRMMELLELPVEATGLESARHLPTLPRHNRSVEFQHVSFAYPGQNRSAVDDVSLTVAFEQTTAIVGPNGSGKTTLLTFLPRLLDPRQGHIFIDGMDITNVRLRSLRQQMAVVTQQTILFGGTIADNIAYGRRHISRERVVEAAQAAFADEFVRILPEGYDTMLGEEGEGLSGGQRQRLAIARAILRDPAILILDEATSQIDAESEARIAQALRSFRRGRTVFIIAHRLSTVVDADRIVVMADGRIVDAGKHDELLKRCELYQTLTRTQLHAG